MKLVCEECGWCGTGPLEAPNPFCIDDTIVGCPACKNVNSLTEACDVPGCEYKTSWGCPTPGGLYMRGCARHFNFYQVLTAYRDNH